MKILFVLNRSKEHNISLHGRFLMSAVDCLSHEVLFYCPNCMGVDNHFVSDDMRADEGALWSTINEYRPDMLVLYRGKGADFKGWVTKTLLSSLSIPKILIDVDFHYLNHKQKLDQYVDLHLLRVWRDTSRRSKCKNNDFFPLAVDSSYKVDSADDRSGICFSGSLKGRAYGKRRRAIKTLRRVDVKRVCLGDQARFYSRHIAAINCSAEVCVINAKHFEIPATGTVLFTDAEVDLAGLLPDDTYIQYKPDCSDIVRLWEMVCANKDEWMRKAQTACEFVWKNHSAEARWNQFVEIVNNHLGLNM